MSQLADLVAVNHGLKQLLGRTIPYLVQAGAGEEAFSYNHPCPVCHGGERHAPDCASVDLLNTILIVLDIKREDTYRWKSGLY